MDGTSGCAAGKGKTGTGEVSREGRGASPEARITAVSIAMNAVLTALKLAAGIWGRSQALVADAVHSLSDFATDFAVLAGVRYAKKPQDEDHPYGHGKYETLAAVGIGLALLATAVGLGKEALETLARRVQGTAGEELPSVWAFAMAVVSIVSKGWLYAATMRTARATGSAALVANAWHHRSDALSSMATAAGVGASVLFGGKWLVLDAVAALFVSVLLARVAVDLLKEQLGALTDKSLSPELCEEILEMARGAGGVSEPHKLRTRMVGRHPVIDMHARLPGDMPLREAHEIASELEERIRRRFGPETIVTLHLEPVKEAADAKAKAD
ncbi:MAG: cation transporter [Kiritimatiellae bacterium]|nr:cation transporter [Kiritimatiellia bacterium]